MFSAVEAVRYLASGNGVFNSICDLIIRPPRAEYSAETDLGPEMFRIAEGSEVCSRTDLTLTDMRGMAVQCSWFHPAKRRPQPCVVYLHGNCGSRFDALEALYLLRHNFSLFSFDATGSGLSDGEFISLGFYERQDLAAVVEYLQEQKDVDGIGLWGRSMGAVTSIMYAAKDPSIKCLVCDSPFSTLRLLIEDLVKRYGTKRFPSKLLDGIVRHIRKRIAKRAGFDIDDLNALKYAAECTVPTFIFHGKDDDFVLPRHSIAVSNSFAGSCLHQLVDGGHNDERAESVRKFIAEFFTLYLVLKPQAAREQRAGPQPVFVKDVQPKSMEKKEEEEERGSTVTVTEEEDDVDSETSLRVAGTNYMPLVPISFTRPRLHAASPPSVQTNTDSHKSDETQDK